MFLLTVAACYHNLYFNEVVQPKRQGRFLYNLTVIGLKEKLFAFVSETCYF